MAKKAKGVGDHTEEPVTEELFRVATMIPRTIINGHLLTVGTVVELTADEIKRHRDAGVPLEEVHAEDNREVYSVREPFAVKEE